MEELEAMRKRIIQNKKKDCSPDPPQPSSEPELDNRIPLISLAKPHELSPIRE